MTAPARRRLLAAMGGAALVPSLPLAGALAPDAELIRWCARWSEAEDEYTRINHPYARMLHVIYDPADRAAMDALLDEQSELLARVEETPATTAGGFAAKARLAMRLDRDGYDESLEEVTAGLLRDLLAGDPAFLAEHDRIMEERAARAVAAREARRQREATEREAVAAVEAAKPAPDPRGMIETYRHFIATSEREIARWEAVIAAGVVPA